MTRHHASPQLAMLSLAAALTVCGDAGLQTQSDADPGTNDRPFIESGPQVEPIEVDEQLPVDGGRAEEVGTLPGSFTVTDDGVARYRIPLALPVGHSAVQPSLELTYASNAGNGLLGIGMALTGMSSVGRCARTPIMDGVRMSVRLEDTDALCLDGQRLVLLSGEYFADGAVYRTEHDTMVRVRQLGWGNETTFVADHPNGRKLSYGTTDDSVILTADVPSTWSLARVDDPFGNHVAYTYASDEDFTVANGATPARSTIEHRPASISMWGHDDTDARQAVTFHYVDRNDRYETHLAGGIHRTSTILSEIRLYEPGGAAYRSYVFEYDESPTTARSRLESVRMCGLVTGEALGDCMPATQFEWSDSDVPEFAPDAGESVPFNGEPWPNQWVGDRSLPVVPMNVNGDAFDDFVFLSSDTATWHVWFGGEDGAEIDTGLESPMDMPLGAYRVDVNGDGRDDLLVSDAYLDPEAEAGEYGDYFRVFVGLAGTAGFDEQYVYLNAGGAHTNEVEAPLMLLNAPDSKQPQMAVADFDGDGLSDLAICHAMHPEDEQPPGWESQSAWSFFYSDGSGGWIREDTIAYEHCSADDFIVVDYDGDGAQNLLLVRHATGEWPSLVDGWYDALVKTHFGIWANEPTGLPRDLSQRILQEESFGEPYLGGSLGQDRVLDLNADGLPDIVRFELEDGDTVAEILSGTGLDSGEGKLVAWLNTGRGFRRWGTVYPTNGGTMEHIVARRTSVLDFEGDGGFEVLVSEPGEWIAAGLRPALFGPDAYHTKEVPTGIPSGLVAPGFDSRLLAPFDWNIDGLHDALVDIAPDDANEVAAYTRQGERPDLLRRITDGYGHRIGIEYAPMTDPEVYETDTTACTYPVVCDFDARPLVRYETHDLGIDPDFGAERIEHSYVDGRTHRTGRGWLGFAQHSFVPVDDSVSRVLTRVFMDNRTFDEDVDDFPFAGKRNRVIRESEAIDGRRRVTDERTDHSVYFGAEGITWFVAPESTTLHEFDLPDPDPCLPGDCAVDLGDLDQADAVRATSTQFEYDAYGNATLVEVLGAERSISRVEKEYGNYPEGWYLGRVRSRVETSIVEPSTQTATRTTTFTYDLQTGALASSTVEPGHAQYELETTFEPDEFGNVRRTTSVSPTNEIRETIVEYDDLGVFPRVVTNPVGHVSEHVFSYRHGGVRRVRDANAVVDDREYDAFGRLTRRERTNGIGGTSEGPIESLSYERLTVGGWDTPSRMRIESSTPGYSFLSTDLDRRGRWTRRQWYEVGGVQVVQTQAYNSDGLPWRTELPREIGDAADGAVERTYDALGRLRLEVRPDGSETVIEFPTAFERRVVDEGDFVTRYVEDGEGRIVYTEDSAGTPTCYHYGPFGVQTGARRGCSLSPAVWSTAKYDAYGRRTESMDPSTGSRLHEYNAFGELVTVTDAARSTTTFRYDRIGRRIRRTDGASTTIWNWDRVGGVGRYGTLHDDSSPDGVTNQYRYDPFGRITQRTTAIGSASLVTNYGRDLIGRETLVYMPPSFGDMFVVEREIDDWGHVTAMRNPVTGDEYWRLLETYPAGMLAHEEFGNGLSSRRTYDNLSLQPSTIITEPPVGPDVQELFYVFNPDGTLQWRGDAVLGQTESFTYDALRRLDIVEVETPTDDDTWDNDYDAFGNFTFRTGVGNYTYDPAKPDRLATVDGKAASYDANGNLKTLGALSITYTPFDVPSQVIANGVTSTYRYDADGLRARRFDGADGSATVYAGDYQRTTIGFSNVAEHRYAIRVGGRVVAEVVRDNGDVIGQPGNPPPYETDVLYLHDDHLGSLDLVTDEDGDVLQRMSFDAFGQRRDEVWTSGVPPDPQVTTIAGFTGHTGTMDGGLVAMPGRWYDPRVGRFLSPDPLVTRPFEPIGANRYVYAWNQPLSLVDPTGFAPVGDCMSGDCVQFPPETRRVHVSAQPSENRSWIQEMPTRFARVYEHASSEIARAAGQSDGVVDTLRNVAPVVADLGLAHGSQAMEALNNFYSGVGDGVIPGLAYVREFAVPGITNYESGLYSAGKVTGVVTSLILAGAPALRATLGVVDAGIQARQTAAAAQALAQTGKVAGAGTAEVAAAGGGNGRILFHGTDAASAEGIIANGLNPQHAARLGGGDVFWATADKSAAEVFAATNHVGGVPAIVGLQVPEVVVTSLVRQGALQVTGAVHQFSGAAWQSLNEFATFWRVL